VQALKDALEKNTRLELAEAAAAKSAEILSETKVRNSNDTEQYLGHHNTKTRLQAIPTLQNNA